MPRHVIWKFCDQAVLEKETCIVAQVKFTLSPSVNRISAWVKLHQQLSPAKMYPTEILKVIKVLVYYFQDLSGPPISFVMVHVQVRDDKWIDLHKFALESV